MNKSDEHANFIARGDAFIGGLLAYGSQAISPRALN